jgi:hypothetical protein
MYSRRQRYSIVDQQEGLGSFTIGRHHVQIAGCRLQVAVVSLPVTL